MRIQPPPAGRENISTAYQKHCALALCLLSVAIIPAFAQTNTDSFTFNIANGNIPDADWNGYSDTHLINVSNPNGIIDSIRVSLTITGGFNGDLYGYLTHGRGFAVLLNRPGRTAGNSFGYGDAGFNITLSDTAANDIHNYGGNGGLQLGGLWQPDGRNLSPASVLDTTPRTSFLSSFAGETADGPWTLFLADLAVGDQSTITSWTLEVTTIPEPSPGMFAALAVAVIGINFFLFPKARRALKRQR